MTAFPCVDCDMNCGNYHINEKYDEKKSITSEEIACN